MRSHATGIVLVFMVLILLAGCRNELATDPTVYKATLNELTEEVIDLTLPLAQAMVQGQAPTPELVMQTQSQLMTVQEKLDALGEPPGELTTAHEHLTEAITQFRQAYDLLETNLETGAAAPFDQKILTLAAHGGEAIHQAAAELNQE